MKEIIYNKPVYLFLLSLFFVFHGYTENYNYIPVKNALFLLLIYLAASLAITGILWILYRNFSKSNLLAFLLMGFYFFFGYLYDNLLKIASGQFVSRYLFIGWLLLIVLAMVLLFFSKKKFTKLNAFLNIFLILLILVDTSWLLGKIINQNKTRDPGFKNQFTVCDTCAKPDIYLIVPDLYAGEQELKEVLNYDNSAFSEALKKRGFRYLSQSRSNYNYTAFSIASLLQMEYLENLKGSNTNHRDLSLSYNHIRENRVTRFLKDHGYQLENFSLFDINNQPTLIKKSILPEKTIFITGQTLFHRLKNDPRFNLEKFLGPGQKRKKLYQLKNNNEKLYEKTRQLKPGKEDKPRFVFTHLMMPHYPYYYDKNGNPRPDSSLTDGNETNLPAYIEYLQYSNQKILSLIDTIFTNSRQPPIIILVSDHGFREFASHGRYHYYFMNLAAVYMPGGNYSSFYDSMSNVNIFRALFNEQFQQNFRLLKDSTCFIEQ